MSFSKYVPPRRKKRVFCTKESPFPVPIESITHETASADTWFYYTAYLTGKNVIVRHSGDINFLYKMGFFGKGNLSRSLPEFNHRYRTARVPHPTDTESIIQPRVQSCRVYKRHVRWTEGDEDQDNSTNYTDSSDAEEEKMEFPAAGVFPLSSDASVQGASANQGFSESELSGAVDNVPSGPTHQEGGEEVWTLANDGKKSEVSWDTEADSDFWAEENEGDKKLHAEDSWDTGNGDSDFWNSEEKVYHEKEKHKHDEEQTDRIVNNSVSVNNAENEKDDFSFSGHTKADCDSPVILCYTNTLGTINETVMPSSTEQTTGPELETNQPELKCSGESSETESQKYDAHMKNMEADQPDDASGDPMNQGEGQKDGLDLEGYDPMCQDDDADGDVLVIEDSDTESRKTSKGSKRKKWRPVLKRDPHPVQEHLQLSFEETFFLSYGLGCLVVIDEKQSRLNLSSLWQRFCCSQMDFLPNYIAYHYYRSKGWVPKTGLKFGCDFIVYKEGPPFYHGSYSVVVKLVDEETLRENPNYPQRNMSWRALSGLNRITEHVAKELLLCYVIKPRGISEKELQSPACIPQFKVQEMLVSRWVSSQERQEKQVEEFP